MEGFDGARSLAFALFLSFFPFDENHERRRSPLDGLAVEASMLLTTLFGGAGVAVGIGIGTGIAVGALMIRGAALGWVDPRSLAR